MDLTGRPLDRQSPKVRWPECFSWRLRFGPVKLRRSWNGTAECSPLMQIASNLGQDNPFCEIARVNCVVLYIKRNDVFGLSVFFPLPSFVSRTVRPIRLFFIVVLLFRVVQYMIHHSSCKSIFLESVFTKRLLRCAMEVTRTLRL